MKPSRLFNHVVLISLIVAHGWHSRAHPMISASLLARLPDMVQAAQTLSLAMATAITYYHQRSHVAQALYEHTSSTRSAYTGTRNEQIPLFPSLKTVAGYQTHSPLPLPSCATHDPITPEESLPSQDSHPATTSDPYIQTASSPQNADCISVFFPALSSWHDFEPRFQPEPSAVQCYWQAQLVTPQPLSELHHALERVAHESAINRYRYGVDTQYRTSVNQRLGEFFELLGATNSPDLIVRIKSRLLLAHCDLEYPWGDSLIGALYGLMKEYFHNDGSLATTYTNDNARKHFQYFVDNVAPEGKRPFITAHYNLARQSNNGTQRSCGADLWWRCKKFFSFPSYGSMRERITQHEDNKSIVAFIECCQKNSLQEVLQSYYTLGSSRPIIQEIFQYYFGRQYDADGLLRTIDPYYIALTDQDRITLKSDYAVHTSLNQLLHLRALCVKTMQQRWNLHEEHASVLYELLDDQGTILHDTHVLLERVEKLCAQNASLLPLFYLPNGVLKDLQPLARAQRLPSCSVLLHDYSLSPLRILLNKAVIAEYEQHNEAAMHFLDTIILRPDTALEYLHHACARGGIETPKADNIPPSDVVPQLDPPPKGDDLIGIIIPPIPQPPAIPELPHPQCGTGSGNPEPKTSETCPTVRRRGLPPLSGKQETDSTAGTGDQPLNPESTPSSSVETPQSPDCQPAGTPISNPEQEEVVEQDPHSPPAKDYEKELSDSEREVIKVLFEQLCKKYPDMARGFPKDLQVVKEVLDAFKELYKKYPTTGIIQWNIDLEELGKRFSKLEDIDLTVYIPTSIALDHIYKIDFYIDQKGKVKITGFHIDPQDIISNSGLIEVIPEVSNFPPGFSKKKIKFLGATKESTFAPSNWSYQKYLDVINDILSDINNIEDADIDRKNQLIIEGISKDDVPIRIVITDQGRIKTAFPDFTIKRMTHANSNP